MVIPGPITPGQVSFMLGFIPVFVAWIYSEFLEYKRTLSPPKTKVSCISNDAGLDELGRGTKEDDQVFLLETELSRPASAKFQASSFKLNIIRFFTMDDSFLLENQATLRAMSEFCLILLYFYLCDRTNLLGDSTKSYKRDLFLFLYLLLIIVSAMTSLKKHSDKSAFSGRSILYLNRHQTEEWKGWMQISYRLFDLTNMLKSAFIPTKDNRRLLQNFLTGIVISLSVYCISLVLLQILYQ